MNRSWRKSDKMSRLGESAKGDALVKEGKIDNAVSVFDRLIAEHPDYLPVYASKAKAELLSNRFQEACRTVAQLQRYVKSGQDIPL